VQREPPLLLGEERPLPPTSYPNCSPVDFLVWGVDKGDINRSLHKKKESFFAAINENFANIFRELVIQACS